MEWKPKSNSAVVFFEKLEGKIFKPELDNLGWGT